MDFIKKYQELISKALRENIFHNKPIGLYEPMNYILELGGKRLRPMMVLMANDLFNGDIKKAIKPALAIELFHNFTLMHDDIMDNASIRRGKATIHEKYNINTAILSGDALFVKAYQFFEELEPKTFKECIQLFSETALIVCEGQQYDMDFETQTEVSFDEYIQMITAKTGVLGAAAFKIGALIAKAEQKEAQALYEFGKHIGIAFQIKDDYLDVFGDMTKFGKKQSGDIIENKKTCLYFLALKHGNEHDITELNYWYGSSLQNEDKIYAVKNIFKKLKVDELSLDLIEEHNNIAIKALQEINMPQDKLLPFIKLADYLLKRDS